MRRFYYNGPLAEEMTLTREESAHILRVIRLSVGDRLVLIGEDGRQALCELASSENGIAAARLLEELPCEAEPYVKLTLYQACIKADKLETTLRHCVELGISAYTPFLCSRCVKQPDAKAAAKLRERMARIGAEAVKQCGRTKIPDISGVISFEELVERVGAHQRAILAYEAETEPLDGAIGGAEDIALIIGPEGGFELSEVQRLKDAGAVSVSLGRRILRAETAALALTAIVSHMADRRP